jgi:hypothetical protein
MFVIFKSALLSLQVTPAAARANLLTLRTPLLLELPLLLFLPLTVPPLLLLLAVSSCRFNCQHSDFAAANWLCSATTSALRARFSLSILLLLLLLSLML